MEIEHSGRVQLLGEVIRVDCMAVKKVRQYFQQWYKTDLGKNVLSQEVNLLQELISEDIGQYFLIQSPLQDLTLSAPLLRNQLMLAPVLELGAQKNLIISNANELPIDSEGIDVHLLHHTLELSDTPHDDLREAARSLLPRGKLVIVGFNSWSVWRLRQLFSSKHQAPWCAKFIAEKRLEDWLKVAGLTLQSADYLCYTPPIKSPYWQKKWRPIDRLFSMTKLPLGGIYVITAIKQTHSLIPLKPKWKPAPVRVSTLTKPVAKEIQE